MTQRLDVFRENLREQPVRRQWRGQALAEWGRPGGDAVVLVHGAGAHAGWWDHLGPSLLKHFDHVVAVDLFGHGDSAWKPDYAIDDWGAQLTALAQDGVVAPGATLIGHSLGGVVAVTAAVARPGLWGGLVMVDSPVAGTAPHAPRLPTTPRVPKLFGSDDEVMAHFRLIPAQPLPEEWLTRHIAMTGVRRTGGGASWKFDHGVLQRLPRRGPVPWPELVSSLSGRVAYLYGEESSLVGADNVRAVADALGPERVRGIPGAHHHVILDSSALFLECVDGLMGAWRPAAR